MLDRRAYISDKPEYQSAHARRGAVAARRAYPNFADGTLNCYCANSNYNSLQLTYQNRLSNGLDFQGTYTFSHSIDTSSGAANLLGPQNPFNLATYRGNSDFDIRHMVVLSWSYKLPFGNGMRLGDCKAGPVPAQFRRDWFK
jgi:hypothetical protein